jgi:hypothetical protein
MAHWWGERFRGAGFAPDRLPPQGSYLAQRVALHGAGDAAHLGLVEWREGVARGNATHQKNKARHQPGSRLFRAWTRLVGGGGTG